MGGQMTRLSRGLLVTVVGIATVAIALVAVGRLTSGSLRAIGPPASRPAGPPTAASPIVARIPLPGRPQRPPWDGVSAIAVGADAVWAARCEVFRVDPRSNQVVTTVVGTGQSAATCLRSVTVGAGMVWGVAPGVGLVRIDPATNRVSARVPIPAVGASVAVTAAGVWAICCPGEPGEPPRQYPVDGTLIRVDPATGRVVQRIHLDGQPTAVAAGPSGVWVVGVGRLWGVDPVTGQVVVTTRVAEDLRGGGRVVVDRGAVWVAASAGGALLRADPRTGRVVARLVGACGGGVVVVGGVGWTPCAGGLLPLDRQTGPAVPLDGVDLLAISDIAGGWDAIWVMTWARIFRVDPHRLR
jgi:streptogramin lyase